MSNKKNKSTIYKKKGLQKEIRKIFENQPNKKYNQKQISARLNITDKNLIKLVLTVLIDLKKEHFLNEYQRGQFVLNPKFRNRFTGYVDATSHGDAYIIVDELSEDIYIKRNLLNGAFHGDKVEVEILRRNKKKIIGCINKVIERKNTSFVGTLAIRKKYAFLIIDNPRINNDIYIPLNKLNGGKTGEKAIGKITSWPDNVDNPFGEITKVIGKPGDNDAEMLSILLKNEFNTAFPKNVNKEVEALEIIPTDKEINNRKDIRNKLTFTIDPEDAKDFDDALSFEELADGTFEIGVHIADVSHFVQPNTALDKEAYKRSNSVYLEDRVIPMLPEVLANKACSLRPNEDKLTFSAIFTLDSNGKVLNEWFGKTAIHSNRRFTYEEAQAIIEKENTEDELCKPILILDSIAKKLRKKRLKKGALSIESKEIRFVLDKKGTPIGVKEKTQKDANKLIEEFMLLANKKVALFVGKLPDKKGSNTQFIYRCHDKPEQEKLAIFSVFIDKFGYDLKLDNSDNVAQKINTLLSKIKNKPESDLIQSMAIRSMAKAVYQTNNIGHYGLAFEYYTHFTSPIRRYADLMVHRILLDKLENRTQNYGNKLNEVCKFISGQERKAIEAERESNKFFQAKYMSQLIGEEFEGSVSGLADFGMFVKINKNFCEGMIPIRSLPDDNYYFDYDKFQIKGRHSGFTFNFGDQVKVKVKDVDVLKKQINFTLL